MTSIDESVRAFATLLARAWEVVTATAARTGDEDMVAAWTQASWELLVEGPLLPRRLAVYDGGADHHANSSRIADPEVLPTHIVVVRPRSPRTTVRDLLTGAVDELPADGIPLESLAARTPSGYFVAAPPFDHVVTGDHIKQQLFSLDEIELFVRPIRDDEI